MTPAMVLECKSFESNLPVLSDNNKVYILGHKCALEMVKSSDGSFEFGLLSRLIMQHAWALAYIEYVNKHNTKARSSAMPLEYDAWRREHEK